MINSRCALRRASRRGLSACAALGVLVLLAAPLGCQTGGRDETTAYRATAGQPPAAGKPGGPAPGAPPAGAGTTTRTPAGPTGSAAPRGGELSGRGSADLAPRPASDSAAQRGTTPGATPTGTTPGTSGASAATPAGTPQAAPQPVPAAAQATPPPPAASPIEIGRQLLAEGQALKARGVLSAALARSTSSAESETIRSLLARAAELTIFSPTVQADDALMTTHKVAANEMLLKIAPKYRVPHEVIQQINGISNASRLRVGQTLKVPRGPFHARIYKSAFRLDLYLQDLYVRSFPVGLGSVNGTPEGTWVVGDRISNPTYYAPPSAPDRRTIPGNDPSNPLGEHWIGLRGVDGAAVGQSGYGIHGTIEPESIGRNASLGCVRMHNEDVSFVFNALASGHSTVTILP